LFNHLVQQAQLDQLAHKAQLAQLVQQDLKVFLQFHLQLLRQTQTLETRGTLAKTDRYTSIMMVTGLSQAQVTLVFKVIQAQQARQAQ
jgi:hypothetical protein